MTFVWTVVRNQIERAVCELGLEVLVPRDVLQRDLETLEIRIGRILSDVELAHLTGVPLHEAVHAHEAYPHLARAHGLLRDALLKDVPGELVPLARSVLSRPPPDWAAEFRDDLCIVARSTEASSEERALCRLLIFEGIWLNLFIAARRTNGRFEGAGAGGRDIERAAGETLAHLLAVPLDEDASGDFRAFQVTLAAAMARLHEYVQTAWRAQLQHFAALGRVHEIQGVFEMSSDRRNWPRNDTKTNPTRVFSAQGFLPASRPAFFCCLRR